MTSVSGRDILRQLKADLIGKDSYRGVTLTYSWLANQFGHFSLGFIPTFILYTFLLKHLSSDTAAIRSAVFISLGWVLFETYNFLGPLVFKRHSHSKVLFVPRKAAYVFRPAWGNVAFDTITDLLFFSFGAFSAGSFCAHASLTKIVLLILTVLLIYPSYYWYRTKIYLQSAQYPYQFRLSQWDLTINNDDRDKVHQFLKNKKQGMHLFIFGPKGSGKTSLSVGVATELSIQHQECTYTTAVKLYSMFFEPNEKNESLWNWRNSRVLVIDDINPGEPIKDIVDPMLFLSFLEASSTNESNRKVMKHTNVIWVLGNPDPEQKHLESWQRMLEKIDINKENILSIHLPSNKIL